MTKKLAIISAIVFVFMGIALIITIGVVVYHKKSETIAMTSDSGIVKVPPKPVIMKIPPKQVKSEVEVLVATDKTDSLKVEAKPESYVAEDKKAEEMIVQWATENGVVESIEKALLFKEEIMGFSQLHDLNWKIVLAMCVILSDGNPLSYWVDTEDRNRYGLMGVPEDALSFIGVEDGERLMAAPNNLNAGTFYLKKLLERHKNLEVALIAYNFGEENTKNGLTEEKFFIAQIEFIINVMKEN